MARGPRCRQRVRNRPRPPRDAARVGVGRFGPERGDGAWYEAAPTEGTPITRFRATIAVFVLVLAPGAWAQDRAECFAPADAAQLDAALARAEGAWSGGDGAAFRAAVQEAAAFLVPCLDAPVSTGLAARLHRVLALQAFASVDRARGADEMRAARLLAPQVPLAPELLPSGHELRLAYEAPVLGHPETVRVPAARGELWFDGTATRLRPADRPTLAQVTDLSGATVVSRWLAPTDPMPTYARRTLRPALSIVAGVAAGLAAGFAGGSAGSWSAYQGTAPDDAARNDRLRDLTNGLAGAAVGFGAVAVGAGIGAAVVGPR